MVFFTWLLMISSFEIEQILDIFLYSFLPQERLNTEQLSSYFHAKIMPRLKNGNLLYIAKDHDKIVGFSIFEKWEHRTYYLAEMAVLPEYQRQGIGTKLVFSIFDKDQNAEKIFLITEVSNKWSQSFYEKIGFMHSSFQHPDYPENFIGYEFFKHI